MRKLFSFIAIAAVALGMVSCGENEPESKDFQIIVDNITLNGATIRITPTDKDAFYFATFYPAAEVENESTVAKYVEKVFNRPISSAVLVKGDKELVVPSVESGFINDLDPKTDYIVIAFKVDEDNKPILESVASKRFTTLSPEDIPPFDIQISGITSRSAKITITPKDDNILYFKTIIYPSDFKKEDGTKYASLQELIEAQLAKAKTSDYTYEEVKAYYLSQGTVSKMAYYLWPETEYIVVALQIDENFDLVGDIVSKNFTSGQRYIDLGLSVLWSAGGDVLYAHYSFQEARATFGNSLPTEAQWQELMNNCVWTWVAQDDAYYEGKHWIVRSKINNNFIVLEPIGYFERQEDGSVLWLDEGDCYYWSRTGVESDPNKVLYFYLPEGCKECMSIETGDKYIERTVRTVKTK